MNGCSNHAAWATELQRVERSTVDVLPRIDPASERKMVRVFEISRLASIPALH